MRVSDPSTASTTVNVIVRVTNENEPPDFKEDIPTLLRVDEIPDRKDADSEDADPVIRRGDDDNGVDANTFDFTDQDGAVTTPTYSVSGADAKYFEISAAAGLTFIDDDLNTQEVDETHTPNYETKSSYSITITARSGGRPTTLDVTIEVVDTEDPGEVFLSQRQPQVGIEIAAIPSDPDGVPPNPTGTDGGKPAIWRDLTNGQRATDL